jgi:hypothetical protein
MNNKFYSWMQNPYKDTDPRVKNMHWLQKNKLGFVKRYPLTLYHKLEL